MPAGAGTMPAGTAMPMFTEASTGGGWIHSSSRSTGASAGRAGCSTTLITRRSGIDACLYCGRATAAPVAATAACAPAACKEPASSLSAPGMMTMRVNREEVSAAVVRSLAK